MNDLDIVVVEEGLPTQIRRPVWLVPVLIAAPAVLLAAAIATALANRNLTADAGTAAVVVTTLGEAAGVTALMLLMLQLTLSSRLHLLDRAFGFDRLMRVHHLVGAVAVVVACLHPMLVYFMAPRFEQTETLQGFLAWHGWPEALGAIVLTLLCIVAVLSIWGAFLELPYHVWYRLHLTVYAITAGAIVHAILRGSDLDTWWILIFWALAAAGYTALLVWSRVLKPAHLRRRYFTVESVAPANHTVCRLTLKAPDGRHVDHQPGQFAFLTLHSRDVSGEEHPFTISSAPRADGTLTFNVKASGDWTSTLPHAMTGDRVYIDGPYGRFSYRFHTAPGKGLMMIAGGVGITPFLSMLEHLAEVEPARSVTLIWANRTEADLFANDQLQHLQTKLPALSIHHVLSDQPDWPGRTGFVDEQILREVIAAGDCEVSDEVFLCGPPPMMAAVTTALRSVGFGKKHIHTERFAL